MSNLVNDEEIKELAEYWFDNRDNKQVNGFSWSMEGIDPFADVWDGSTHKRFYNKAKELLSMVNIETAKKIVSSKLFEIE